MRIYFPAILLLFVFLGCTSTKYICETHGASSKDSVSFADVQKWIQNKEIQLFLINGREYFCIVSQLRSDSLQYQTKQDTVVTTVPIKEVLKIVKTEHLSSALGGFGVGLMGGWIIGFSAGSLVDLLFPRISPLATIIGNYFGLTFGALGGLTYGAIHGTVDIYQLSEARMDSTASKRPSNTP